MNKEYPYTLTILFLRRTVLKFTVFPVLRFCLSINFLRVLEQFWCVFWFHAVSVINLYHIFAICMFSVSGGC